MPATAAVITPIAWSGITVLNKRTPIKPPTGSDIPDKNEYKIAKRFLPVEWKIGSAIAIPSGILWIAIAIATGIPSLKSWLETKNVAIPSGKLCQVTASAVIKPAL